MLLSVAEHLSTGVGEDTGAGIFGAANPPSGTRPSSSTTSASPLPAILNAAPVPTAMTLTSMPRSCLKRGTSTSSSPLSCVLVSWPE
jgi:hypothetical protein